jgi:hypothetical protein
MANCSIPNSTAATGRTSTRSSRRSRKPNSAPISFLAAFRPADATSCWTLGFFNAQRSTSNAQRSIHPVGRWMLGVGRWAFSVLWRVKGAWWPSRSSKPSSPRKRRGRFDSYPLRLIRFDERGLRFDLPFEATISHQTSTLKHQTFKKGGDLDVA